MWRAQRLTGRLLLNLAVALGGVTTALPFLWMVSSSFKSTREILSFPPSLVPETLRLDNVARLFDEWPFLIWYGNSLLVALFSTLGVLFFCSLAGFAFAKYRFRGKTALFALMLGSSMIPFPIILVPLFILTSRLGWTNSNLALIVPFLAPAIGIFLMRQFISTIEDELIDAARIDGASAFRIYWQIILPLVRPGLATLAILTFLGSWNSFLWPLVVLRDSASMTLPVGMANILSGVSAGSAPPYGPAMVAATFVSIPVIALFVWLQRYYIEGLTAGALNQ